MHQYSMPVYASKGSYYPALSKLIAKAQMAK